jgi:hypothetical protein
MSDMGEPQMTVWAVVYGNYEPTEVDSLWATEELAKRRKDEVDAQPLSSGMWDVVPWTVGTE